MTTVTDKLLEKWGGYSRVLPIRDWFPIQRLTERTTLGAWSWSLQKSKVRYIIEHGLARVDDMLFTHSDLALAYLDVKYPKPLRCNRHQYDACVKVARHVPLYADRGHYYGDFVYLDMVSAYWQILQRVGWDVEYMPNRYLSKRSDNVDFPYPTNKLARNSLVSIALLGRTLPVWTGERIEYMKIKNRHANMILWATVQDVLNGIADDMVKVAGALYVHTDGYIIRRKNLALAEGVASEWGIKTAIKRQSTYLEIKAVGHYKMSEYETKNFSIIDKPRLGIFYNINPIGKDFLRNRFSRLGG